ncbi:hypothetical protein LTR84_005204 [Exophiala bonariae]|uniref:Uncharacterized protein n=1 Tax=Exophiala bonariae TaxID=1690606 RepID=A0AAV9NPT7_9EURO|nr:hypothetical protein LTR84_005204 [Exophiala bonariae]
MSSWFSWGQSKGKRILEGQARKKAFEAVYVTRGGPGIETPQGQADFTKYANAKKDPKSAQYMRDMERCTNENRTAVGRLQEQKIAYRDFAYPARDGDQKYSGSDSKGKGKDRQCYDSKAGSDDRRRTGSGGGGASGGAQGSGQSARDYYSSWR